MPEKGVQREVMDRLRLLAPRNNVPLNGTFELTYRCQLSCHHCYVDPTDPHLNEISTELWLDVLREIAGMGCLLLTLTGGEPTLHPAFPRLVEESHRLGVYLRIYTNAYDLDEDDVDFLAVNGVRHIHVSLYGPDARTHDGVTGVPGSFDRTSEAIRRLRAAGITVVVGSVLLKDTFHHFARTRRYIHGLGACFRASTLISPSNMGSCIPDREMLDADDLISVGPAMFEKLSYPKVPDSSDIERMMRAVPCTAGSDSFSIAPDGTVMPCLQIRLSLGNVQRQSFWRIWNHSPSRFYLNGMRYLEVPDCLDCANRWQCSRCAGIVLIETGSLWRSSPTTCRHTETWIKLYSSCTD